MCRAHAEGGRRCKGHWSTEDKVKHNRRRRENRAIRKNAAQWALAHGDADLAARIEQQNPGVVKGWLKDQGIPADDFVNGVPDGVAPSRTAWFAQPAAGPRPAAPVPPAPGGAVRPAPGGGMQAMPAPGGRVVGPAVVRHPASPATPVGSGPWSSEDWATDELRPRVQALLDVQGTHRDERSLLSGAPKAVTSTSQGTNSTSRVELSNGMVGYHKTFSGLNHSLARGFGQREAEQCVHEAAAWQLASRLGPPYSEMVPPVVLREVHGQMGSMAVERPGRDHHRAAEDSPEWREAAFFDSLIGQQDRHPGNYLMAGDRLTLIDHGYTFARPGDYQNYSWLVAKRVKDSPTLTYQERNVLQRLVSSPDLLGLRSMLASDRADALHERAERMLRKGRIVSSF